MAIDLKKFDLRKEIVFNLSKNAGIANQKAQVILCMDISGSMGDLYRSGFVQEVIERIVPVAMQFDDNGELDLYMFETNCKKHPTNVTLNNIDGFVDREILGKYNFGGTNYSPPIKMIQADCTQAKKGLFGSKPVSMQNPAYVIFITDGENSDHREAEAAIKEISKFGVFFQFVGIGSASFSFLQRLDTMSGRFIDNANFFQVKDLKSMTDEDLYGKLLAEYPTWLKEARSRDLIATI